MNVDQSPETAAPVESAAPVEEEPRVRIEQWAGDRERHSAGVIELLMAFVRREESAGHVRDLASAFEQQFLLYCAAPVID